MNNEKSRLQFIETWGVLGTQWGISRSMAQIHALLLLSLEPLSTEDIMDALHLSRGNANMNIRELMNWSLIYKVLIPGERKEFFKAEQDIWTVAVRIIEERKKRELIPAQQMVQSLLEVNWTLEDEESKHIKSMLKNLNNFLKDMNALSNLMCKTSSNKFLKNAINLLK